MESGFYSNAAEIRSCVGGASGEEHVPGGQRQLKSDVQRKAALIILIDTLGRGALMPVTRHTRIAKAGRSVLIAAWLCLCNVALAQAPAEVHAAPADLVRTTIRNELKAAKESVNFMFRSRKQTSSGSQTKMFVQTREATAAILIAVNDQPLTPQQRQGEEGRLRYLIKNPDEIRRKQKQERDDAERTTRIMRALPDAFLYEYDGTEKGTATIGKEGDELVRLRFRPNEKYDPPSRVEQVLTGMQGLLLIDAKQNRIAKMDGTLFKDVGFGWGILGHLDKGGHFLVEQAYVGDSTWAITRMQLSFTGKAFFFKNIAFKHEEVFSDFRRVPDNLSFAEGVALLEKAPSGGENQNGTKGQ